MYVDESGYQLELPLVFPDERAEPLRAGVDPERRDPEIADRVADLLAELGAPASMADEVNRWVERFRHDPEAKLRKRLAREAGIPYSAALARWADPDDLAAELADAALRAEDHAERCQSCGTRPDEWLDRSVEGWPRPVDNPPWKFYLWDCYACDMLYELNQGLTSEDRERGQRWTIKPRDQFDPTVDGF